MDIALHNRHTILGNRNMAVAIPLRPTALFLQAGLNDQENQQAEDRRHPREQRLPLADW
jgi:hypothetical protein